jgi:hypothetical protein
MVNNTGRHYKKHILTGFIFPAIVCCCEVVLWEKVHWDICVLLLVLRYVVIVVGGRCRSEDSDTGNQPHPPRSMLHCPVCIALYTLGSVTY